MSAAAGGGPTTAVSAGADVDAVCGTASAVCTGRACGDSTASGAKVDVVLTAVGVIGAVDDDAAPASAAGSTPSLDSVAGNAELTVADPDEADGEDGVGRVDDWFEQPVKIVTETAVARASILEFIRPPVLLKMCPSLRVGRLLSRTTPGTDGWHDRASTERIDRSQRSLAAEDQAIQATRRSTIDTEDPR